MFRRRTKAGYVRIYKFQNYKAIVLEFYHDNYYHETFTRGIENTINPNRVNVSNLLGPLECIFGGIRNIVAAEEFQNLENVVQFVVLGLVEDQTHQADQGDDQ